MSIVFEYFLPLHAGKFSGEMLANYPNKYATRNLVMCGFFYALSVIAKSIDIQFAYVFFLVAAGICAILFGIFASAYFDLRKNS